MIQCCTDKSADRQKSTRHRGQRIFSSKKRGSSGRPLFPPFVSFLRFFPLESRLLSECAHLAAQTVSAKNFAGATNIFVDTTTITSVRRSHSRGVLFNRRWGGNGDFSERRGGRLGLRLGLRLRRAWGRRCGSSCQKTFGGVFVLSSSDSITNTAAQGKQWRQRTVRRAAINPVNGGGRFVA